MRWIINLFRKKEYHGSTAYDFLSHYADCEAEVAAIKNYMREQNRTSEHWECSLLRAEASKDIRFRYGLKPNHLGFVWYLLDQFYKGNITIKKDAQPKP